MACRIFLNWSISEMGDVNLRPTGCDSQYQLVASYFCSNLWSLTQLGSLVLGLKPIVSEEIGKIIITNIYITDTVSEAIIMHKPACWYLSESPKETEFLTKSISLQLRVDALGTPQTGVTQLSDFYRVFTICWWWLKQNKAQMDLSPNFCLFLFCLNSSKHQRGLGFCVILKECVFIMSGS